MELLQPETYIPLNENLRGYIPGDLFDEFARIRRVKFNTEVESVNVRSGVTFVNLQLLTEFLTLIEPLLEGVSCYNRRLFVLRANVLENLET